MAALPVMSAAYDAYFRSGLYAERYPRPNAAMIRLIRSVLPPQGAAIDFGCGNGRYLPVLLAQPGLTTTGYDISAEAIAACREHFAQDIRLGRLRLVLGSLADLTREVAPGTEDAILLLFGVLGHIRGRAERIATLRTLRGLLRPGGRLLVTVPNRLRRFRAERALCADLVDRGELEPGDILYRRVAHGAALELYYHLFTPAEFLGELEEAGFVIRRSFAESVVPERVSIAGWAGALLDGMLRRICPLPLAYGFGAVAERPWDD